MSAGRGSKKKVPETVWVEALTKPHTAPFAWLPHSPRCAICGSPFAGLGGAIARLMGVRPWQKNPTLCTMCWNGFPLGGAEVDVAVMFANLRGSTALGEQVGAAAYAELLNGFYRAATTALVPHRAIIDKLIGDEVMALFLPFTGPSYRQNCVAAAVDVMHNFQENAGDDARLALGIGLHAGPAYVGKVGQGAVNTASRIQHEAAAREIVISEGLYDSIRHRYPGLERRIVELRGKQEPLAVRVLRGAQA